MPNSFREGWRRGGEGGIVLTWFEKPERMEWKRGKTTKFSTAWPATQLGPRGVKAGLGDHEDGILGASETLRSGSLNVVDWLSQIIRRSVILGSGKWNSSGITQTSKT